MDTSSAITSTSRSASPPKPNWKCIVATWNNWYQNAPRRLIWNHLFKWIEQPGEAANETIVLTRRLPDPVNSQLANFRNVAVEEVICVPIRSLQELVDAFEKHQGERHLIRFQGSGDIEALPREESETARSRILQTYGIPNDRRL